jgi:hypothetical protein
MKPRCRGFHILLKEKLELGRSKVERTKRKDDERMQSREVEVNDGDETEAKKEERDD